MLFACTKLNFRFKWGLVDINFNVREGEIKSGKVFSDCLVPEFIDIINEVLQEGIWGFEYSKSGFEKMMEEVERELITRDKESYEETMKILFEELREYVVGLMK